MARTGVSLEPDEALRSRALTLLDAASGATNAYGRDDLTRRLAASRARLADPALHVLVVGEFKQGKSSLVNALLAASICPVDDDVATAVPTLVRFSDPPRAAAVYEPPADRIDTEPVREEIPLESVAEHVTEAHNPENRRHLRAVEIGLPQRLLAQGLVIVDTPGVGGLGSVHGATTLGALPMAEAVVFVSDASQEYTEPELAFLRTARDLCPNVVCVLTKIDFYPEWRTILELDRRHLEWAGLRSEVFPLSSALRARALRDDDPELHAESGFPAFIALLGEGIGAGAERLAVRAAGADLLSVCSQLELQSASERTALADAGAAQALVEQLRTAREQAERLRGVAARWQQTLNDGVADLSSDIDHDLRVRTRQALAQADEAIDASDPADVWDEFEPWLYRRLTQDVALNYTLLQTRASELAVRVGELFDEERGTVGLSLPDLTPDRALESVPANASLSADAMGLGEQGLTVLKGSYGAMMMFGMLANLVGLSMMSPAVVAMGLIMGRKTLQTDQERQVSTRRNQARAAVRKYADEVGFAVGKDSRDSLRRVHRQLRDHFAGQADELHRSTTEALSAAQQAIATDEAGRSRRRQAVEGDLARITALRRAVLTLAPDLAVESPDRATTAQPPT